MEPYLKYTIMPLVCFDRFTFTRLLGSNYSSSVAVVVLGAVIRGLKSAVYSSALIDFVLRRKCFCVKF